MTPGNSVARHLVRVVFPLALASLFTALPVPHWETVARAEDKTAARDHWERGTKFYDLGKYDDAIREFEAAYEAKGDPAFLYNLAQSHRLAGHPADSLRFYRTYLRYVPKAPNRGDIELRIKELEKVVAERPGTDSATTAPAPAGTATAPSAGTSGPGNTAPSAQNPPAPPANAWPPAATGTMPAPGDTQPPPATNAPGMGFPPAPSAEPTPVPQKSGRRTAGIVIAAAGGGLFVVGAIFGAIAKSQGSKIETAADNGERYDPSVQSLGKSAEGIQWLGYGLGAIAIATGIVLVATAPRQVEAAPAPR
ncbi:MAG: hypothetical protein ABUS79_08535, partial [Pseudomonadota bacterium]